MSQSNIDELKNNPDYVYLGNYRFIKRDIYEKAMREGLEKIKDTTFIGETEHPESDDSSEKESDVDEIVH